MPNPSPTEVSDKTSSDFSGAGSRPWLCSLNFSPTHEGYAAIAPEFEDFDGT